jgi:hypothetical protein
MAQTEVKKSLPESIVGLTGRAQNNTVLITWGTVYENDNENFIVQRSEDGATWNDIGLIHGTGGALWSVTYCFVDTSIHETGYSYRLKVLNNGSADYSSSISVKNLSTGNEASQFWVYPNPTKNMVYIKSEQALPGDVELAVYNSRGEQVYTSKIKDVMHKIDLTDYKNGQYYVRVGTQIYKVYKE